MTILVCPASSSQTEHLLRRVGPRGAAAAFAACGGALRARRACQIGDLRAQGRLAAAERFGWLSLAGCLLGLGSAVVLAIDPASDALDRKASPTDRLPTPLAVAREAKLSQVAGTEVVVLDPTDPYGFAVVRVAARVAGGAATIELAGVELAASVAAGALIERLTAASGEAVPCRS